MNDKKRKEVDKTKEQMIDLARGPVIVAKSLSNAIDPNDHETANILAVKFGGWGNIAEAFPEIILWMDQFAEKHPDYNLQTLVGITAICRGKGFEINMSGLSV